MIIYWQYENIIVNFRFIITYLFILTFFCSIEGEYVLKEGDRVNYRTILHPPKLLKKQAVEVVITQYTQGPREKWAETKVNSQHKRF